MKIVILTIIIAALLILYGKYSYADDPYRACADSGLYYMDQNGYIQKYPTASEDDTVWELWTYIDENGIDHTTLIEVK